MRWDVRAFRHEAKVAQIALIDDLPEVMLRYAIDLHGLAVVDEIEQRRKSAAERHAAATTVADVEDSLHLLEERFFIVKIGVAPIDPVARGCVEVTFAR